MALSRLLAGRRVPLVPKSVFSCVVGMRFSAGSSFIGAPRTCCDVEAPKFGTKSRKAHETSAMARVSFTVKRTMPFGPAEVARVAMDYGIMKEVYTTMAAAKYEVVTDECTCRPE